MITYLKGDATKPVGDGTKYIVHVCNNLGGWGAGFVLALSKRWAEPEKAYRGWRRTGIAPTTYADFKLGSIDVVEIPMSDINVVNMVAQDGFGTLDLPPIRYDMLHVALSRLAIYVIGKGPVSFHMPRIGCGLAGGKWEIVERIISETLGDHAVYVYDYTPQ